MEIKDLLNRTITCKLCKGQGKFGEEICKECNGMGIAMDNFVTDLLLNIGIRGEELTLMATAIYDHYDEKLVESYNRGVADGEVKNKKSNE